MLAIPELIVLFICLRLTSCLAQVLVDARDLVGW